MDMWRLTIQQTAGEYKFDHKISFEDPDKMVLVELAKRCMILVEDVPTSFTIGKVPDKE